MIKIRDAKIADAKDLLEIYDHYVKNTAITFEITTPDVTEFESRMRDIMSRYPYIVIEEDGRIEGYAYAQNKVFVLDYWIDYFLEYASEKEKLYDERDDIEWKIKLSLDVICIILYY